VRPSADSIPIILDHGLPRDAASILRQLGHNCVHVGEIGMSRAEDREIMAWAREREGAVVVTLNADFHAELSVSGARSPSVIRLRMQGLDGPAAARLVRAIVHENGAALIRGCMVSVTRKKIRVRWLPIGNH
jgi:predicted nuclease of predicted toxin-antitoxin system